MSDPHAWNETTTVRRATPRRTRARARSANRPPKTQGCRPSPRCTAQAPPPQAYNLGTELPGGGYTTSATGALGAAATGCLSSLSQNVSDAHQLLSTKAPALAAGLESGRAWVADTAVPAVQTGVAYARDVALPAATTFVQETAVPAARTAVAFTRDTIFPALQETFRYARDVALPAVRAAWDSSAPVAPAAPAAAPGPGLCEPAEERTVRPSHAVPDAAGHDEALPHAARPGGEGGGASGYASVGNVMAAAVEPRPAQKDPLLADAPAGPLDIDAQPAQPRY
jgi:hypothetical protein